MKLLQRWFYISGAACFTLVLLALGFQFYKEVEDDIWQYFRPAAYNAYHNIFGRSYESVKDIPKAVPDFRYALDSYGSVYTCPKDYESDRLAYDVDRQLRRLVGYKETYEIRLQCQEATHRIQGCMMHYSDCLRGYLGGHKAGILTVTKRKRKSK